MRVFGYPDMRLHAAEHTHFLKELTEIERRSIEKSIEKELLSFLGAWMSKHILASDRDFARYVLAGGAALAA
jgi:hemerythrin-like metal-binding protein